MLYIQKFVFWFACVNVVLASTLEKRQQSSLQPKDVEVLNFALTLEHLGEQRVELIFFGLKANDGPLQRMHSIGKALTISRKEISRELDIEPAYTRTSRQSQSTKQNISDI